MTDKEKKNSAEIEELKQTILECRGLYKGFKINETTANALALHLHLVNYRKAYLVRQEAREETAEELLQHLHHEIDREKGAGVLYGDFNYGLDTALNKVQHLAEKYSVEMDE